MVTVYTKPNCPQCVQTKRVLDRNNVEYKTVDLTEDPASMKMVQELGFASAPVVITPTDKWAGFKLDKLQELKAA
jgi:glutaredoxin-like protein NrdH